jgi:flap endonuclease-1
MAQEKAVWAVGSRDYDSLLFGAPRLVRYLTIQGREFLPSKGRSRRLEPESIETARMLESLGITRSQLVDVAILIGTDFNKGVRGVGPKTALKLIHQYGILENLPEKHAERLPSNCQEIRRIFLEPAVRRDFSTAYTELDEAGLLEFLCDQRGFNRDRVMIAIERMKKARMQPSLKKWIDVQ